MFKISIAVLFWFLVPVGLTFADSYSRSPGGSGSYHEVVFDVTLDDLTSCNDEWYLRAIQFDPSYMEWDFSEAYPTTTNTISHTEIFTQEINVQQIIAFCAGGSLPSLEFNDFGTLFTATSSGSGQPTATTTEDKLPNHLAIFGGLWFTVFFGTVWLMLKTT